MKRMIGVLALSIVVVACGVTSDAVDGTTTAGSRGASSTTAGGSPGSATRTTTTEGSGSSGPIKDSKDEAGVRHAEQRVFDAFVSSDIDTLLALETAACRAKDSKRDIAATLALLRAFIPNLSEATLRIDDVTIAGDTAKVSSTLLGADGKPVDTGSDTSSGSDSLVYADGAWRPADCFGSSGIDGGSTTTDPDSPGSKRNPLAIGRTTEIEDWTVTVTTLTASMPPAASTADPPASGNYVGVEVKGVYHGKDQGDPYDLTVELIGNDKKHHDESGAFTDSAAYPQLSEQESVEPGGVVEGWVLFDVPASVVPRGLVGVSSSSSFTDRAVYWAVG